MNENILAVIESLGKTIAEQNEKIKMLEFCVQTYRDIENRRAEEDAKNVPTEPV